MSDEPDPVGRMAAMGSELRSAGFGGDPTDPVAGQDDGSPNSALPRDSEPDAADGVPSGDDSELGDRS